ncbi:MAG: type II secretion system minor pseudopilin GspH [Gammaproteobacteria bacterium]
MSSRAQRGISLRAGGFTLIEILVVVVIIGVMATLAVLSIGSRTLDDRMALEARRLHELLALAADEAVLQGIELGFVQTADGYEFLVLKDGHWAALENPGPLRRRAVNEPFYLQLQIDGRRVAPVASGDSKAEPVPQVILLSSGDATEFVLDLRARQFRPFYRLHGDALGRVTLDRKEAS